jgi:hypothetical protein
LCLRILGRIGAIILLSKKKCGIPYSFLSSLFRTLRCYEKFLVFRKKIPQFLFKNLKILDLGNTLVVEIQKGILLYSCHIVRKFLNIDTEHNTQQSQNVEARRR